MRSIGLAQAKAQLSALLDAVASGDEVVITRRGKPVARLVREGSTSQAVSQAHWMQRSAFDLERLGLLERRSPGFEQACEWVKDSRSPALHGAMSAGSHAH
mgnify:CR=1 FL=1